MCQVSDEWSGQRPAYGAPVLVVLLVAPTDVEFLLRRHGDISRIEQAADVVAWQQAVPCFMRATAAVRPDMRGRSIRYTQVSRVASGAE